MLESDMQRKNEAKAKRSVSIDGNIFLIFNFVLFYFFTKDISEGWHNLVRNNLRKLLTSGYPTY